MILLICLVTFLVLFGSCINKTKQIHDVNKITFNNECVADLTDSFDCNYIALETNDDCLIGSPAQVQIIDNRIFVLDTYYAKKLFVFELDGKFVMQVGVRGGGPKEYSVPSSFKINNQSETIIIHDSDRNKLIEYDLRTYKFRRTIEVPFSFTDFEILSNGNIAWYSPLGYPAGKPHSYVLITDTAFKVVNTLLKGDFFSGYSLGPQNQLYLFEDDCFGYAPYSGILYKINSEEVLPKYEISFGEWRFPPMDYLKKESIGNKDYVYSLFASDYIATYSVYETARLISVNYDRRKKQYLGLYDKQTNKTFNYSFVQFEKSLKITGFRPPCGTYNNYIISALRTEEIVRCRKNVEYNKFFDQVISNCNSEDNPVLFLFKYKNADNFL
ncbi:MAG: 6-bladed beta-propeller [Fusobacteriaceae bacterium]|nr:6-bladed beta-propeller [Fusobacteriaceae bacterium]